MRNFLWELLLDAARVLIPMFVILLIACVISSGLRALFGEDDGVMPFHQPAWQTEQPDE